MAQRPKILCLHVRLDDVDPAVWRRIEVDADITLRSLHHILQAALGWTSSHLHEFDIGGAIYSVPDEEEVPDMAAGPGNSLLDDRKGQLGRLVQLGQQFTYLYDFGDSWQHTILVESATEAPEKRGYGIVVDGAGACPPENVGGSFGYTEFLDAITRRPRSAEARQMLAWAGGDFKPGLFDRRAANAALLRLAWNGWDKE